MTNYDTLKEYEAHKTPVPSYDEYVSLINWKEDLTTLCTAKERIIEKYENIDTWWQAENTKLKELLKECKEVMSSGGYIFATVKQVKRARKLLENIDQALGEE